eukprot:590402-Rhodomonas_salina.1
MQRRSTPHPSTGHPSIQVAQLIYPRNRHYPSFPQNKLTRLSSSLLFVMYPSCLLRTMMIQQSTMSSMTTNRMTMNQ